jgi:glycosyltransferase involved in cell wall biosynthesis
MTLMVLLLLPESPYPPRSGNALRDVQQISILQKLGYRVRILAIRRRPDVSQPEERFLPDDVELVHTSYSAIVHEELPALIWRKVGYLLWSTKHAFAWWTEPWRPAEFLIGEVARTSAHAVILRSMFVDTLKHLRRVYKGMVVVDCHDADVHAAAEMVRCVSGIRRVGPWVNLRAVRRSCRVHLPLADEVWAVSDEDAQRIRRSAPCARIIVVPSGMAPPTGPPAAGESTDVLMVAGYGYGPNANGLKWFLKEVWPLIRANHPHAQFNVIGSDMPRRLGDFAASQPGVHTHGAVPDLKPYYENAGVVVVPILEGAGTRLKIIDAFRHGKAVVTTTKGIEGIHAPPQTMIVADTPNQFADSVSTLLSEPSTRLRLGRCSQHYMAESYSHPVLARVVRDKSVLAPFAQKLVVK